MAETTTARKPRAPRKAKVPVADGEHLSLRFVRKDFTSYGGFQWPREIGATVTAPDWSDTPSCGRGLHAWLWGEGAIGTWSRNPDDLMIVVRHGAYVDLGGTVKFPTCTIAFIGDTASAPKWLAENGGAGRKIILGTATAGDRGTATAGEGGTATAGDRGTAIAGYRGTATAGYGGIFVIRWYDGRRYRLAEGIVGENGILPNTAYQVVSGKLVAVSK